MTFLQKLVNDKINGDHPLRLELDKPDVLGSYGSRLCSLMLIYLSFGLPHPALCALEGHSGPNSRSFFFFPVPDLLSDSVNILLTGFLSWFSRCLHHQLPSCSSYSLAVLSHHTICIEAPSKNYPYIFDFIFAQH